VGLDHTSVPRWSGAPPGADRSGRSFAVMSFSDAARAIAQRWQGELADCPVWTWHSAAADDEALAALREQLAGAAVGWRLLLAGPEHDVLRARAEAVRAGVLDAEITVSVSSAEYRRVWCAHCGTETGASIPVGAEAGCTGCGRSLLVHHHFSRRHATYLGFQVDAEEMP
jgi:dimethylamine monooxygenase subunit C